MSARTARSVRVTAAAAVTAAVVVLFVVVTLNAVAAGDGVASRQLERALWEEQRRYDRLVAEVAELEDLRRVESVATGELGMVPAAQSRFLSVDTWEPQDAQGGR